MESYFRNKSIVSLITKWKYHLIVIAVITAAVTYAITFTITPMYKSFAVFYPANILPHSDESETEQLLEYINSQDIRNQVFESFDLANHYEIDTADPKAYTKLNNAFESNVSFSKTENEAVQVTVYDKDPQVASDIVDSIIVFCNQKIRHTHMSKSKEALIITENALSRKWNQMEDLVKRQNQIRKEYQIYDYKIQVKQYLEGYIQGRKTDESKEFFNNLSEHGDEYRLNDSLLWDYANKYSALESIKDDHYRDVNKKMTYTHVVTSPYPADTKASPKRMVIVFFTTLAALLMSILVIAFIESKKQGK